MTAPKLLFSLCFMLLFASCGQELFSVPKNSKKNKPSTGVSTSSNFSCSQSTLIRPPVDILILMDNSSSANYISAGVKVSLANLVNQVSSRFDYRIALAPILATSTSQNLKVLTRPDADLTGIPSHMLLTTPNQAVNHLQTIVYSSAPGGSAEAGISRSNDILSAYKGSIFRKGAYHIVTVVSNGDDHSYVQGTETEYHRSNYLNQQFKRLMCLRGGYSGCSEAASLQSKMMRFLSIVSSRGGYCSSNITSALPGNSYWDMSARVYNQNYDNGVVPPSDQGTKLRPDFTDLCGSSNLSNVFNDINNIIKDVTLKHVYRFWPVANSDFNLDPETIRVTMDNGVVLNRIPDSQKSGLQRDYSGKNDRHYGNPISGWIYHGNSIESTRFLPSIGEPHDGHLIELFGSAKVTFPNCLRIEAREHPKYYGYAFVSDYRPLESSIEVYKNGSRLSNSSWTLTGPHNGHSTEIYPPSDYRYPAIKTGGERDARTGYYIKLNGIHYTNQGSRDEIDVISLPMSN